MRTSILDPIENFFGERVDLLDPAALTKLSKRRQLAFAEHVDAYLLAARDEAVHETAVILDSTSDPIMIANAPTAPRTTRRAKQVALYHHEVLIPLQPFTLDYSLFDKATHLLSLIAWCRQHHSLVRRNVISFQLRPNFLRTISEAEYADLLAFMSDWARRPENAALRDAAGFNDRDTGEFDETSFDACLASMLVDGLNGATMDRNLSFLDAETGALAQQTYAMLAAAPQVADALRYASPLQMMDFPAIDDVPEADFVAIREQSDDFEEFRNTLQRTLDRTAEDAAVFGSLQRAFSRNLDEVRDLAGRLRRETKDRSLGKLLRERGQAVSISAVASAGAAAVQQLAAGSLDVHAVARTLGVSVPLACSCGY